MKTLYPLLLLAALLSLVAWFSLPGESKSRAVSDVPVVEALPTLHWAAPPSPAPAPSGTPAKTESRAFETALATGDVCETARLLTASSSAETFFRSLIAVSDVSLELKEVFGVNGPMLAQGSQSHQYKGLAARTAWALKLAGMIDAPVSIAPNLPASRALLLELGKSDPGNAFYPLLRLAVEAQLGLEKDVLKATAEEIETCTKFYSPVAATERELRELAWKNPAIYYSINNYFSIGNVSYYPAVFALKHLEGFTGGSALARLMTEEGLHASRPSSSGEFERSRYVHGRSLDPEHYPDIRSLDRDRMRGIAKEIDWPLVKTNGPEVCDPGPFERVFWEMREEI